MLRNNLPNIKLFCGSIQIRESVVYAKHVTNSIYFG